MSVNLDEVGLAKAIELAEKDAEEFGLVPHTLSDHEQYDLYIITRSYQFNETFRIAVREFLSLFYDVAVKIKKQKENNHTTAS